MAEAGASDRSGVEPSGAEPLGVGPSGVGPLGAGSVSAEPGRRPLPGGLTAQALAAADAEADPSSLAAAGRLRKRFGPELAAAAATQSVLRRRAVTKFGAEAATLYFTRDGLEQATRPAIAALHADRFVAAGIREVIDLGCGIGADARAFAAAGLAVRAVELDPHTAAVAAANLHGFADTTVTVADAVTERSRFADVSGRGWFLDPARRTGAGRIWRVTDFSPPWSLVTELLRPPRVCGVKLGPGLPHQLIPDGVAAEWVSHHGDTVEAALWSGGLAVPGSRRAVVLRDGLPPATFEVAEHPPELAVTAPRRVLIEPDGAVIRAGGVRQLGADLGATLLAPGIAYLTADKVTDTPYGTAFDVHEVLPYKPPVLRRWLAERGASAVEIKKRGVEVDPAELRRLILPKPKRGGDARWTLIITPTGAGVCALAVRRTTNL